VPDKEAYDAEKAEREAKKVIIKWNII